LLILTAQRLKKKIGTHALPTAELELNGAQAYLMAESGVKAISSVLNITRMYSCVGAVAALGRARDIAHEYAKVRVVGGRTLAKNPLHMHTLSRVDTLHLVLLHFVINVALLLGISENTPNARDGDLLRLLTPVAKAFCAARVPGKIEECSASTLRG